jgi:hypothetical protein
MGVSINEITKIVLAHIPEKDRQKLQSLAEAMVQQAALSIVGDVRWWWKRIYIERDIAATDTGFDFPDEFERFSTENMTVVDSDGLPLAKINYRAEQTFDELAIEDKDIGNLYDTNGYPQFYTIRATAAEGRKQQVQFLAAPQDAFTIRMFGYRFPSSNDVDRITNGMAVAFYALTLMPGLEDKVVSRYYTLYGAEKKKMEDRNMADEDEMLIIEMDERMQVTNTHIRNVQGRKG